MKVLLENYYGLHLLEEIDVEGKKGFRDNEYIYFTIPASNNKAIHMEQATLAYHLAEIGYRETALPIPNMAGEWITTFEEKDYLVMRVQRFQARNTPSHGQKLATFHQQNMKYQYEPQYVSSYGQWKQLWIDKLTYFEHYIAKEGKKQPQAFFRILNDIMPYLIGISENAIQYIRESEAETQFEASDQGTICFHRYENNLLMPIIWPKDLVYDHKTRDLAEFIRSQLFATDQLNIIHTFLGEYESVQPLSLFSWRLLYARLLFPIQIYDFLTTCFQGDSLEDCIPGLESCISTQITYENNLRLLFHDLSIHNRLINIPRVHWL